MKKIHYILQKANGNPLNQNEINELIEISYRICHTYFRNRNIHLKLEDEISDLIIFRVLQMMFTPAEGKMTYILSKLKYRSGDHTPFANLYCNFKNLLIKSVDREIFRYYQNYKPVFTEVI